MISLSTNLFFIPKDLGTGRYIRRRQVILSSLCRKVIAKAIEGSWADWNNVEGSRNPDFHNVIYIFSRMLILHLTKICPLDSQTR